MRKFFVWTVLFLALGAGTTSCSKAGKDDVEICYISGIGYDGQVYGIEKVLIWSGHQSNRTDITFIAEGVQLTLEFPSEWIGKKVGLSSKSDMSVVLSAPLEEGLKITGGYFDCKSQAFMGDGFFRVDFQVVLLNGKTIWGHYSGPFEVLYTGN